MSTSSRKRTRWDNAEEEYDEEHKQDARPPPPKRRPKSNPPVSPRPAQPPPPRPKSSSSSLSRSHSILVPPRTSHPPILPSRSVYAYERLNQIEEGSYGVVYRARDKATGDIVALKKLKLDEEKGGFPVTSLREVMALMGCRHENVVRIREVVVGETLTQ